MLVSPHGFRRQRRRQLHWHQWCCTHLARTWYFVNVQTIFSVVPPPLSPSFPSPPLPSSLESSRQQHRQNQINHPIFSAHYWAQNAWGAPTPVRQQPPRAGSHVLFPYSPAL